MFEKYTARDAKREIGRILWDVWDPIGVNHFPEARDEYDSYVNELYMSLVGGASDDDLAIRLFEIASKTMGLSGATIEAMRPTVAALRAISPPKESCG